MISPWIKVEATTPDKPEVIAIAAKLNKPCDLIVGKLFRFWCWADQNSVAGEAVSVTEKWIDSHVGQKGFSKALRSVGWLAGVDLALEFPNFSRHNGDSAKKRAGEQRKKAAQRERDKCPDNNGTNIPEEKGRDSGPEEEEEEEIRERESARADAVANQAERIVAAYPRREGMAEALAVVAGQLREGESFEAMLSGTKAAAAIIRTMPSGPRNRYVPAARRFFEGKRWMDDPETLRRQGNASTGQGQMDLEEAKRQLGGRAAYLEQ